MGIREIDQCVSVEVQSCGKAGSRHSGSTRDEKFIVIVGTSAGFPKKTMELCCTSLLCRVTLTTAACANRKPASTGTLQLKHTIQESGLFTHEYYKHC